MAAKVLVAIARCLLMLGAGIPAGLSPGYAAEVPQPSPAAQTAVASANAQPASTALPARFPTSAFAAANIIRGATLSPDGQSLAFTTPVDGAVRLAVSDPITKKGKLAVLIDAEHELNWFKWAGSSKVLFSVNSTTRIEGEEVRYSRLMVSNIETGKTNFVGVKNAGFIGDDLLFIDPAGQFALVGLQRSIYDYPSVWRLQLDETAAKSAKEIQRQIEGVWNWYADNVGIVRMATLRENGKYKVLYRQKAGDPLKSIVTIGKQDSDDKIWDAVRLFQGTDEGYAIRKDINNRAVLVKVNYATRTTVETAYANPASDVTDFDIDDANQLTAVYYTDDQDEVVWFDPKMKKLRASLGRALPGSGFWISSRSKDATRMLVWQSSESDPGALYMFDATNWHLDLLANLRPSLDPAQLVTPKAIDYKARDGVTIRAYLTLPKGRPEKALPLVILPHGGPYYVRDKLEYSDEVQFLANRGYAVLQPNYRGSDGYGEGFAGLGEGQIGRTMQDDLDDGMDALAKQGVIDAKRVCLVGASYGGYAAVWGAIRNPERYRCAASFAGVMDWKRQLKYQNGKETDGTERRKWSTQVKGGNNGNFDLDTVSPAKQATRLTRPVLLVHGDKDTRVPFSQFKEMTAALTMAKVSFESIVMPGEGHGFDKREDEEKWYTALETFLAKNNPAE